MPEITRRQLLGGAMAGAAALSLPRPARAHCAGGPPKVLEIFLKGGFDPWLSFWNEPIFAGLADPPVWSDFTPVHVETPAPGLYKGTLGEGAYPLAGTSLIEQCRVLVMEHELIPHELAVPYAITGSFATSPDFASLGAAVNASRDDALKAFVLDAGHAPTASDAADPGDFGVRYRPPVIRIGGSGLTTMLERHGVQRFDAVERLLETNYQSLLVHPETDPDRVRSQAADAYESASYLLHERSAELAEILSGVENAPNRQEWDDNDPRVAIRVALELLTVQADYVCVVDAGVYRTYDTHDNRSQTDQAGNFWNVCESLALAESAGFLDGVLVVINTEFGRLQKNANPKGTEHWPHGYVNILMGAPFAQAHRLGHIQTGAGPTFAHATVGPGDYGPYRPQDVRAVLASYLGVVPDEMLNTDLLTEPLPVLIDELLEGDVCD